MTSFFLTSLIPIQVDIVHACLSSESVKTLLLKGKAPVDPECTLKVGKVRDSSIHSFLREQCSIAVGILTGTLLVFISRILPKILLVIHFLQC